MTVLLVVAMFAIILLVDHFMNRQEIPIAPAAVPQPKSEPRLIPSLVGGFRVMDNVRYHPGHTWALSESPKLIRVGLDDFAAKVAGKIERVTGPTPGQWVRQGQKVFSLLRNGHEVDVVSPIEGTVVEINPALKENPAVALDDPYGDGWLMRVDSPDAKTNFRNLLGGNVARRWMDEAAGRLRMLIAPTAPALAQDGGIAVRDLTGELPADEWEKVAREFFLS